MAEDFNNFFIDKIIKIRNDLDLDSDTVILDKFTHEPSKTYFESFEPYTEKEIEQIIKNSSNASCQLDPIPTVLLKKCLPTLLPYLTHIVNLSLQSGELSQTLKTALVRPLLKKPTLNSNEFKNFPPVKYSLYL